MTNMPGTSVKRVASAFTVVLLFAVVTAVLMVSLRSAKHSAFRDKLSSAEYDPTGPQAVSALHEDAGRDDDVRPTTLGHVKSFVAEIELTPRRSVGTERPESIYEAAFHAAITAKNPTKTPGDCEVQLPLPPQLISLADLTVTVNGEPDDSVERDGDALVWSGVLDPDTPAKLDVTYTAVGKGIYTLTPPPGRIVDTFEATLTANESDIRMLELCLQPQHQKPEPGKTVYTWKYDRLMFGRPIAVDVLGIAPADQLGELGWLGPVSVLIFGVLVGLLALAFQPDKLDKWMLLLMVGAFAGGYPLMYFAQDFLPLTSAIALAAGVSVLIIAIRAVTLFGPVLGFFGAVLLAATIQTVTLGATIWPETQGLLLTVLALGTLVVAMMLLPRAQKNLSVTPPALPEALETIT